MHASHVRHMKPGCHTVKHDCTYITARPGQKERESYYFDPIHKGPPPPRAGTLEGLLASLTFIPPSLK